MTLNVTSFGSDNGARPIFERHGEDVENAEDLCGEGWKAGTRNDGIETSAYFKLAAALRQRRLAGANIV